MTIQQEVQLEMWKERLVRYFQRERDYNAVCSYIASLLEREFPVILGINHLAKLIGVDSDTLKSMVMSSKSFYRSFCIPKRRGGERQIDAPYPSMLKVQSWIYSNILSKIEVNDAAMGFVPERSIVDNAFVHNGKKCLLMMDVKDFFPSIKWYKVYSVFRKIGYPKNISQYLASLCCLNGCIPQGAVTSPSLSNIICRRLDVRVFKLARAYNVVYTRYADDVTFSGEYIPKKIVGFVTDIFKEEGFELQDKKTKLIRGQHRKIVTGISVSSGKLTVPKNKRRQVRQAIFYIRRYGLKEHQEYIGNKDPIYLRRLIGYLHFWQSVEPSNRFVEEAISFLNEQCSVIKSVDIGNPPAEKPIVFDEYNLQFDENIIDSE